jgi:thiol-disulfide isomerase/thioredoxin
VLTGLTGCSTSEASGGASGFIEGPGTLTWVAPADRTTPREFTATTLTGEKFALTSTRGQVTVVNVWASWCPPCRAEAPGLVRLHQALGERVAFVGVNTRDEVPQATAYVENFAIPYPNVEDDGGAVLLAFRDTLPATAIPSTLVLDPQGRIAARVLGGVTEARLRDVVERVLGEAS